MMFDPTDRLFTKGQRAIQAQEFALAISHLTHAIETDPLYPHLYMYLGIAQSELGEIRDAEVTLQKAATLAPDNPVIPTELGILHLDAGDPEGATAHFRHAQMLSPQYALVAAYLLLCRWGEGDLQPLRDLRPRLRDLPRSVQARVLLRVEQRRLTQFGPSACIEAIHPLSRSAAPRLLPSSVIRWANERRFRRAKHALFRFDFEDVLSYLHDHPGLLASDTGASLAKHAHHGSVMALGCALEWLAAQVAETSVQKDRRDLLARLAGHQYDLGDYDAAENSLSDWRSTFRGPVLKHDEPAQAEVLLRMADIRARRAAYADAKRLCAEARPLRPSREVDWIDAIAHLGLRDLRACRHRLESFLKGSLFKTDVHVGAFLETVR